MTKNELIKKAVEFHKAFAILQEKAGSNLLLDFDNLTDFPYTYSQNEILWNEDKNIEHLEFGAGFTYSIYVNYIEYEDDEFLLVDGDNGCGNRHSSYLFSKVKEVKYE